MLKFSFMSEIRWEEHLLEKDKLDLPMLDTTIQFFQKYFPSTDRQYI